MDLSFDELSVALSYAVAFTQCSSTNSPAVQVKSKPDAKKPAVDDNFDDMFGDEPEAVDENGETAEEKKANEARAARMANALRLKQEKDAKDGKVKKEKEKPVERSLLVLEVKPWEG